MKALIKLTGTYDDNIWVNPDYIASLSRGATRTCLCMANDAEPILVKETPEEIISLIKSIEE